MKLAIITTHPIQYYAPIFQLLAKKLQLKVFYTAGEISIRKYDHGFNKEIEWDIPLLQGYEYEFLENMAKDKGSHHFKGIICPNAIHQIKKYNPDAILIYGWANHTHLKILRLFKGKIPIYFRGDSTLLDYQSNFKNIMRQIFLKWVYSHVDTAFYVGTANKAYFKKYGLKENQLIFAPHAIDNERFGKHQKKEADLIRQKFAIKSEDILILFAGKLEPKKNPDLLLQAFIDMIKKSDVPSPKSEVIIDDPQTKNPACLIGREKQLILPALSAGNNEHTSSPLEDFRRTGVHLLFVGSGVLEESLKEMIKNRFHAPEEVGTGSLGSDSYRMTKSVHFMDFQNQTQMPAIYQACDLFCLPSQGPGETWGLAVNEAMAAGKAILISDKVGCAEDLVNAQNGAVFQSENLADFTQKLIALTTDKITLKKMGENSLKLIQKWSFEKQFNAIVTNVNR